ncbi:MAG: ribonuclease P protein component 1 [Candidatus Aenigmatarchaeota archaeon]
MITPENLVRHELMGLTAMVRSSTNQQIVGISGKVIDESRNTFVIETPEGREVTIVKDQCEISFRLPSGESVRVDGKLLVARPEDRIKKKFPKS